MTDIDYPLPEILYWKLLETMFYILLPAGPIFRRIEIIMSFANAFNVSKSKCFMSNKEFTLSQTTKFTSQYGSVGRTC